jgi:hypothetical protein
MSDDWFTELATQVASEFRKLKLEKFFFETMVDETPAINTVRRQTNRPSAKVASFLRRLNYRQKHKPYKPVRSYYRSEYDGSCLCESCKNKAVTEEDEFVWVEDGRQCYYRIFNYCVCGEIFDNRYRLHIPTLNEWLKKDIDLTDPKEIWCLVNIFERNFFQLDDDIDNDEHDIIKDSKFHYYHTLLIKILDAYDRLQADRLTYLKDL